ncbi:hypothetical protein CLV35_2041 [Motilibacter peucedani]|uniref:Uncharacterized protein n=1 Tax=Motilibacter peucedani TaxID=598650 RepID=A0A420XQM1_9ACTN|nr:hypothetical protein CLV35_2041 [Motilibacter peucedani]
MLPAGAVDRRPSQRDALRRGLRGRCRRRRRSGRRSVRHGTPGPLLGSSGVRLQRRARRSPAPAYEPEPARAGWSPRNRSVRSARRGRGGRPRHRRGPVGGRLHDLRARAGAAYPARGALPRCCRCRVRRRPRDRGGRGAAAAGGRAAVCTRRTPRGRPRRRLRSLGARPAANAAARRDRGARQLGGEARLRQHRPAAGAGRGAGRAHHALGGCLPARVGGRRGDQHAGDGAPSGDRRAGRRGVLGRARRAAPRWGPPAVRGWISGRAARRAMRSHRARAAGRSGSRRPAGPAPVCPDG